VTEVNPAGVNVEPPRATGVVPIVIVLFVNALLGILLNVFKPASIVLFVSVCVAEFVVTVESIATVTAVEPL